MNGKFWNGAVLLSFLLLNLAGVTWSRRYSRQSQQKLADWQVRYLEKIQLLAREGGLAEWEGITNFDKDVCYDKSCLDAALEFMMAVNFTVDPCNKDTWADFACTRRLKESDKINQVERLIMNTDVLAKKILDGETAAETLKDQFLLKEAQTYFYQCNNKDLNDKEDVKSILNFLSENYGDWPIFTNGQPGEKFDWVDMVADLNRIERYGFTPLILKASVAPAGVGILLNIGQTTFSAIQYGDFYTFFQKVQKNAELPSPFRVEQIQLMQYFQNNLQQASIVQSQMEQASLKQFQLKSDDFFTNQNLPTIDWLKFFKTVFTGSSIEVTPETQIALPFVTVMNVLNLVAKIDKKVLANTLNFQLASLLLQESTSLLDDMNTFKCTEEPGSREAICLARTMDIFGYSLGKTFLDVNYDDAVSTPIIQNLMTQIQLGYINVVKSYNWMADSTKNFLIDKIQSMKTNVALPNFMREDPTALQKFYKGFAASTDKNSSYPINFLMVNTWYLSKKRDHDRLVATIQNKDIKIYDMQWNRYLGSTQATFHKVANEVRIEGGIIQKPLFSPDAPGFMNFGGLGTVLGHEIGHSFDTQGRTFNKYGAAGEFWDAASVAEYNKWVNQLAEAYGKEVHQISETEAQTVNSQQTLWEDIADFLGVHIGYQSYLGYLSQLEAAGQKEKALPGLKSFAPQKLFYIKYANMWCDDKEVQDKYGDLLSDHSSGNTRATMPLMLSNQFAQTFGCKPRN